MSDFSQDFGLQTRARGRIKILFLAVVMVIMGGLAPLGLVYAAPDDTDTTNTGGDDPLRAPEEGKCTSILPGGWCDDEDGVGQILKLILDIMTMGVAVLATVGVVISGIQWLTARDNETQLVKAKSRIFNIVIGLVVWALMWLVLSWLLPGGLQLTVGGG